MCNCVWKKKEWPSDWKQSVYVPINKKGDKKECGNYRTIALISHASKVLLRVLQKKVGGVPDTRTSDRASWFQKRKKNEGPHCKF